jgi:hypothetical protein
MNERRWLHRRTTWMAISIVLSLVACAKSFDMSAERLTPLGSESGIVIGSVLVKAADDNPKSGDAADMTYQFDIVQSLPGSPDGSPNAKRYRLEARAGEERTFVSSLREGPYLFKSFAQERIVGVGGDLGLVFESRAGEIRYIGRLVVEVPQRVSRGKEYRFTVENARASTLTQISVRHPELAKQAVDAPMRTRERLAP